MNTFTQVVFDMLSEAIEDDEQLRADLKAILLKEYTPFLSDVQSLRVNIHQLKTYVQDKMQQWIDWLPDTTINQLGAALAQEALSQVYWSTLAGLLHEQVASLVS